MQGKNVPSRKSLFLYVLALLLLFALLWPAVWSAVETGKVVVGQVGRYGATTELVPWTQGWARFAGPLLLFLALETWRRTRRFWTSLAMAVGGAVLVTCSIWFTSLQSALAFPTVLMFIAAGLVIGRRFGWLGVAVFAAAAVALGLWIASGGS
jgi:hypothetical protein